MLYTASKGLLWEVLKLVVYNFGDELNTNQTTGQGWSLFLNSWELRRMTDSCKCNDVRIVEVSVLVNCTGFSFDFTRKSDLRTHVTLAVLSHYAEWQRMGGYGWATMGWQRRCFPSRTTQQRTVPPKTLWSGWHLKPLRTSSSLPSQMW